MENGIIDKLLGLYTPLSSRLDIKSAHVQCILHRNHHSRNLFCACSASQGKELLLEPRRLRNGYTIARDDISEHASFCFLKKDYDHFWFKLVRASEIFCTAAIWDGWGTSMADAGSNEVNLGPRTQFDTFQTFARGVFSRALSEAFVSTNRYSGPLLNPTALEVLCEVDQAVKFFQFEGAINGYEAARKYGGVLRFGLVFDPIESSGIALDAFSVYWFTPQFRSFALGLVAGSVSAMKETINTLKILKNHRTSPYFIIAVQDADGRLNRVYLHQVLVAQSHLVSVDSKTESFFGEDIIKCGFAVISVLREADFSRVLGSFGFALPGGARWKFRPDFLWISKNSGTPILNIRARVSGNSIG